MVCEGNGCPYSDQGGHGRKERVGVGLMDPCTFCTSNAQGYVDAVLHLEGAQGYQTGMSCGNGITGRRQLSSEASSIVMSPEWVPSIGTKTRHEA